MLNLEKQNFQELCQQLEEIATHNNYYIRTLSKNNAAEFECAFEDANNPESIITITFFAANYVKR